jgi:hypothetical protein
MKNPTLFDQPIARSSDPETSHEAAKSVSSVPYNQARILRIVRLHGPLTDEEIYDFAIVRDYNSPSGARTRRHELVQLGHVVDSGKRKKTKSGRNTIMWEAK